MYCRRFRFAGINIQIESDIPLKIVDYFAVFEKEYEEFLVSGIKGEKQ